MKSRQSVSKMPGGKKPSPELPATVRGLVDEYNRLKGKDYAAGDDAEQAADKLRMAELLRQIQSSYAKPSTPPAEQELNALAAQKAKEQKERAEEVKRKLKESLTGTGASKVSRE